MAITARRIYLDHHATTPCDPRVVEAMLPYFSERFGNAASRQHLWGREASEAVEHARRQVAGLIGASSGEIVFTSGATEADNLALEGLADRAHGRGRFIASAVEHPAVLGPLRALARRGFEVETLPVDGDGRVDPGTLRHMLRDGGARPLAVAVMAANNEVGTVEPLRAIGAVCRDAGVPWLADAAQAVGKIPFDVHALGVALAALSAHKIYGPKGVGALYVRARPPVRLAAQLDGGGQERGLRAGTLNVPGIVGFGVAAELAASEIASESRRLSVLRDHLLARLRGSLSGVRVNGSLEHRLPHNLNVAFAGIEATMLLAALDDVAASSGSACSSDHPESSHVLRALGLGEARALGSVRFGLGHANTREDIDYAADRIIAVVRRLRGLTVP